MNWTYQGKQIDELPEGCEAFVYLITNLTNNMKYVGKKLAKFKKLNHLLKAKKIKDVQLLRATGETIGAPAIDLTQMLNY